MKMLYVLAVILFILGASSFVAGITAFSIWWCLVGATGMALGTLFFAFKLALQALQKLPPPIAG